MLPNSTPSGAWSPAQALDLTQVPLLAQDTPYQVDTDRWTTLLQIRHRKLAYHVSNHIQHHRSLGSLRAMDEPNPAIKLPPCAEDYHTKQIFDPRIQVVASFMPVGGRPAQGVVVALFGTLYDLLKADIPAYLITCLIQK